MQLLAHCLRLLPRATTQQVRRGLKKSLRQRLDYSRYPELREQDLRESFVRGSGPGGQRVNKRSNCVSLVHVPTGVRVKCHQERQLELNRSLARDLLRERLDALLNGEQSVARQTERLLQQERRQTEARAERRRLLKKRLKEDDQGLDGEQQADGKSDGGGAGPAAMAGSDAV